jgi:alcohol dehydrogenase class IV
MTGVPPLAEQRKFIVPELALGLDAHTLAGRYARNLGVRRALLVSDPGVARAGWTERVAEALRSAGVWYELFEGVSPNPRDREVMAGAEAYRRGGCDGLVAVGGGSPMDAAKAVGIVVTNGRAIGAYEGVDQIAAPIPPLVCVPTTAGSSADVSQFAIISDDARRLKFAIISKAVIPDASLIDPRPLTTMAPEITAATGMDALTHAVEAYVSNASSPLTDLAALEAVRLVGAGLLRTLEAPADLAAREVMARASLLAGMAFSNAILGVVHAVAHAVGGLLDAPHGACNAYLLEHSVRLNHAAAPERYRAVAEALGVPVGGRSDPDVREALVDAVARLRCAVGLTGTLGRLGVTRGDVPRIAENALRDPCMATNPRAITRAELEAFLEQAL